MNTYNLVNGFLKQIDEMVKYANTLTNSEESESVLFMAHNHMYFVIDVLSDYIGFAKDNYKESVKILDELKRFIKDNPSFEDDLKDVIYSLRVALEE